MAQPRKSISVAVIHPRMRFGGSEACALWTLEALKRDYRVALIAGGRIDLSALNAFYGTSIDRAECETVEIPLPWPLAESDWGAALRGALVDRRVRRHLERFDVLISSYNPADFVRPGIHLLADFSWDLTIRQQFDPAPSTLRRIFHMATPARRAYLALARAISDDRGDLDYRDAGVILANSHWSKRLLRDRYGIDAQVLYPPVAMQASMRGCRPMADRFVCIGRIRPEKRIERIIEILRRVRARGHDVSLHIIGNTRETPYSRSVERRCKAEGKWVVLEGRQVGESKMRLLGESAYGIHARSGEAFGIAVAEMVIAGCVPFVPHEGGPAEIVGHSALLYRDEEDAVEKICAVLSQPVLRARVREHLQDRAERFSTEPFMRGIRAAVDTFVEQHSFLKSAVNA